MNPEFKVALKKNVLKLFLLMLCLCILRPKMKVCETYSHPAAAHPQLCLVAVLLFQGQEEEQESTYPGAERQRPWQS